MLHLYMKRCYHLTLSSTPFRAVFEAKFVLHTVNNDIVCLLTQYFRSNKNTRESQVALFCRKQLFVDNEESSVSPSCPLNKLWYQVISQGFKENF